MLQILYIVVAWIFGEFKLELVEGVSSFIAAESICGELFCFSDLTDQLSTLYPTMTYLDTHIRILSFQSSAWIDIFLQECRSYVLQN